MNAEHIGRAFAEIGARFQMTEANVWNGYSLDIGHDRKGQFFKLQVAPQREAVEVELLQKVKAERHLLLLIRLAEGTVKHRFLCGHDEREWFVAAVPGAVSNVAAAREELKPWEIRRQQVAERLNARQRKSRHNRVYRRQGEWFFVPVPHLVVAEAEIHRREPIYRGSGKSHWVEELYRWGGHRVYVHPVTGSVYTDTELKHYLAANPNLPRESFKQRVLNAIVYARGRITHPDHRTLVLHGWHQVLMNRENESAARRNLAFLD